MVILERQFGLPWSGQRQPLWTCSGENYSEVRGHLRAGTGCRVGVSQAGSLNTGRRIRQTGTFMSWLELGRLREDAGSLQVGQKEVQRGDPVESSPCFCEEGERPSTRDGGQEVGDAGDAILSIVFLRVYRSWQMGTRL